MEADFERACLRGKEQESSQRDWKRKKELFGKTNRSRLVSGSDSALEYEDVDVAWVLWIESDSDLVSDSEPKEPQNDTSQKFHCY